MTAAETGRILAVRVGRGGDLVMITPALRMLLEAFPRAELHLVTTEEGPRVLRGFDPRLTRFLPYHRRIPGSWIRGPRLRAALRRTGYDRVYVFESLPHYRDLVAGVAPEIHFLGRHGAGSHYCDRCLDLVAATLPGAPPRGWVSLPVSEGGRQAAAAYRAEHGLGDGDVLVGLHLTFSESARGWFARDSGGRHRQWPIERGAALARMIHQHGRERGVPLRPVLDVLPQDRALAGEFRARAGGAVTVMCGAPDFERYKAMLQAFRLLVTPNTGPMHMAAAVGTPVVALFSGWSPAECGPFVPPERRRVVRAEDMPGPGAGLAAIPAGVVFEACLPFLS